MRKAVIATVLATAALLVAGSASAATIVVQPGESIQAAIDQASPGDTIVVRPGTYHENLTITKDNLTLKASGGLGSVLLVPGQTPSPSECTFEGFVEGICVVGEVDQNGNLGTPVTGTRITGFTIARFSDFGILLFNANETTVSNTEARNNGSYGISGFVLSGVRFIDDVAHDNGGPGFYIGDSPNANALLTGNSAYHNGLGGEEGDGFLFRDSSNGIVRNNRSWNNCLGFNFVDSPENPDPTSNWKASGNHALRNNLACGGEEGEAPPLSGIGFLLFGSHNVDLRGNVAKNNVPSGPSGLPSGGIIVVSSAAIGGADPTDNTISGNVALHNSPWDIFWDETGSGNVFNNNACKVSHPSFICAG